MERRVQAYNIPSNEASPTTGALAPAFLYCKRSPYVAHPPGAENRTGHGTLAHPPNLHSLEGMAGHTPGEIITPTCMVSAT